MAEITGTGRRKRTDGERSRAAILGAAARLATVEGLDGLTIGRLADEIGMSKSGLYAHFGSKEELQLATIGAAEAVFDADVVLPAQDAEPGLDRLNALCERFMAHVESGVFPGGCFFTSVLGEFDTRPGRVHDRVAAYILSWVARLRDELVAAMDQGEITLETDFDQVVFEIQSALLLANTLWVLTKDPGVFQRASTAISSRIASARPG
jgi:AcrR family transcriptional regulator